MNTYLISSSSSSSSDPPISPPHKKRVTTQQTSNKPKNRPARTTSPPPQPEKKSSLKRRSKDSIDALKIKGTEEEKPKAANDIEAKLALATSGTRRFGAKAGKKKIELVQLGGTNENGKKKEQIEDSNKQTTEKDAHIQTVKEPPKKSPIAESQATYENEDEEDEPSQSNFFFAKKNSYVPTIQDDSRDTEGQPTLLGSEANHSQVDKPILSTSKSSLPIDLDSESDLAEDFEVISDLEVDTDDDKKSSHSASSEGKGEQADRFDVDLPTLPVARRSAKASSPVRPVQHVAKVAPTANVEVEEFEPELMQARNQIHYPHNLETVAGPPCEVRVVPIAEDGITEQTAIIFKIKRNHKFAKIMTAYRAHAKLVHDDLVLVHKHLEVPLLLTPEAGSYGTNFDLYVMRKPVLELRDLRRKIADSKRYDDATQMQLQEKEAQKLYAIRDSHKSTQSKAIVHEPVVAKLLLCLRSKASETRVQIPKNQKISVTIENWKVKTSNVSASNVRFYFDSEVLDTNLTWQETDVEDEDIVDIKY